METDRKVSSFGSLMLSLKYCICKPPAENVRNPLELPVIVLTCVSRTQRNEKSKRK